MRICISSKGKSLDSEIDPCFGRSLYFIIIDPDSLEFEAIENPYNKAAGGSGIDSALFVAKQEIKVLLTEHCGPNAFHTLQAAGIEVFLRASGTVKETLERYKNGEFEETPSPDVIQDYGMPEKTDSED
jgi:predicted Fe-Mo cluster-binding NifX family protein